jgi:hypothetical protein
MRSSGPAIRYLVVSTVLIISAAPCGRQPRVAGNPAAFDTAVSRSLPEGPNLRGV